MALGSGMLEKSPTNFEVEQTVKTKTGARTSTLDTKNNYIILITIERPSETNAAPATVAAATPAPGANQPAGGRRGGRGGGFGGPGLLDILVVGRQ